MIELENREKNMTLASAIMKNPRLDSTTSSRKQSLDWRVYSLLMGLTWGSGYWHGGHRTISPGQLNVDTAVNARRAFPLRPTLQVELAIAHDSLTRAHSPNHYCDCSEDHDHDQHSHDRTDRPMAHVGIVVGLFRHFCHWRSLLVQRQWHFRKIQTNQVSWINKEKESCNYLQLVFYYSRHKLVQKRVDGICLVEWRNE